MRSGAVVYSAVRPVGRRWPIRGTIGYASLRAPIQELVFPIPSHLTVCPYLRPSRIPDGFPRFALSDAGSISAQVMRAILLASATATSILGLRASILASQGSVVSPRRAAFRTTDIAPVIRSRLRSRWPILDILPSLGLPPVVCCLGTARGGEVAPAPKALHRRCEGLQRHRSDWPDPRYRHEAHRLFVLAGAGVHILLQSAYLLVETSNLLKQKAAQLADLLR